MSRIAWRRFSSSSSETGSPSGRSKYEMSNSTVTIRYRLATRSFFSSPSFPSSFSAPSSASALTSSAVP